MKCPLCHHAISVDLEITFSSTVNDFLGEVFHDFYIYKCPNCNMVFINDYEYLSFDKETYNLTSYPSTPEFQTFDKRLYKISPSFIITFDQALSAESSQLNKITGLAFRKAFEILVKDYAIYLHSEDDSKEILKMTLSCVINKYFQDTDFKSIFQKISWLGNDHSHTFNKHEDYDVKDLKRFIYACISKIISQLDLAELDNIEPKNN